MSIQLADATILVNNEVVPVTPNSVEFDEGLGEQKVRVMSIGGGKTEQVYANDLETNFSTVKFAFPTTPESVKQARGWKTNQNKNVVVIAGETSDGKTMTRTFTQAALTPNYKIPIGTEADIEVEFMANAAI